MGGAGGAHSQRNELYIPDFEHENDRKNDATSQSNTFEGGSQTSGVMTSAPTSDGRLRKNQSRQGANKDAQTGTKSLINYVLYSSQEEREMIESMFSGEFFENVRWLLHTNGHEWLPCERESADGRTFNVFELWAKGRTGYPIVDAGMRELLQTGFMHGTSRRISASFLIRCLGIDWRLGQKHFAQNQIDYLWNVNVCNWHWIASLSMFATEENNNNFDPATESAYCDPQAVYIKQWLPGLKHVPAADLHNWQYAHTKYHLELLEYYPPCIDVQVARSQVLHMYRDTQKVFLGKDSTVTSSKLSP